MASEKCLFLLVRLLHSCYSLYAIKTYCRSAWDRRYPADFIEVVDEQVHVPSSRSCPSCETGDMPLSFFKSSTSSVIRSIEYHHHDYIRYQARSSDQSTCFIGQISGFIKSGDEVKIVVYKLGRERDRKGPGFFAEVRRTLDNSCYKLLTLLPYLPLI